MFRGINARFKNSNPRARFSAMLSSSSTPTACSHECSAHALPALLDGIIVAPLGMFMNPQFCRQITH